MIFRMAALLVSLVVLPGLAAADSKTIRDWNGDCDTDRACVATAPGEAGSGYQLRFSRDDDASATWAMRFRILNVPQPKTEGDMAVSVDGGEPFHFYEDYGYLQDTDGMTFGLAGGEDLTKLFAQIKKGKKLTLSYEAKDGKTQKTTFSLSGLAAVLLWIDEQQKRVGKSSEISYPPSIERDVKAKVTEAIRAKIEKRVQIDCDPPPEDITIDSYYLPGGFLLHVTQCFSGPYNFSQLYFFERKGDLDLIYFADYDEAWSGTNQLFNSEFEPKTGRLVSFYKGRGIGDCGSTGQWVWSGYSFRLTGFRAWPDCENGKNDDEWTVLYKYEAK